METKSNTQIKEEWGNHTNILFDHLIHICLRYKSKYERFHILLYLMVKQILVVIISNVAIDI